MKELMKAIRQKALSSAALAAHVTSDVFFDQAWPDAEAPYVVFYLISSRPEMTFADGFEDALVQFSIFSKERNPDEVVDIYSDLDDAFHRADLTYDSHTNIGCFRESSPQPPTRMEDVWTMTADYRIRYHT